MFEGTKEDTDLGQVTPGQSQEPGVTQSLKVGSAVTVSYKAEGESGPGHVVLEWEGSSTNDMVADAVIAIILQVCSRGLPVHALQRTSSRPMNHAEACKSACHESILWQS